MAMLSKKQESSGDNRCEHEVVIKNRNGLHARPAAMFVKVSSRYRSDVWVEKDGERVNGKSIMGLMMLAAGKGSKLMIIAEGADAEKVVAELAGLIDTGFGED